MRQENLIDSTQIHRRGERSRPILTEQEIRRIRGLYDAAEIAARHAERGAGIPYEAALKVEIHKRKPEIDRVCRKAARRCLHNHPMPEEKRHG